MIWKSLNGMKLQKAAGDVGKTLIEVMSNQRIKQDKKIQEDFLTC